MEKPNFVINGAAESFVDSAIFDAKPFILSNVYGTQILVDASVKFKLEKFIQISTDEVYGHLKPNEKPWSEHAVPKPRNPYSASKFAAELIIFAANQTHGLQYNITRSCNILAEDKIKEIFFRKLFIPHFIMKLFLFIAMAAKYDLGIFRIINVKLLCIFWKMPLIMKSII